MEAWAEAIRGRPEAPSPEQYDADQAAKDQERLIELICARAQKGLTAKEDAEDAHLRVRWERFLNTPDQVARRERKKRRRLEARSTMSQSEDEFHGPHVSGVASELPAAGGNLYAKDPERPPVSEITDDIAGPPQGSYPHSSSRQYSLERERRRIAVREAEKAAKTVAPEKTAGPEESADPAGLTKPAVPSPSP